MAVDTYEIAKMYKYLRVCDVGDALDAVGRPNICLMDPAIRPLFQGLKFWGPAVTRFKGSRSAAPRSASFHGM